MNVFELIEFLQKCDPQAEVAFGYNGGNYWRETNAQYVVEAEAAFLESDNYSGGYSPTYDPDGTTPVVLLVGHDVGDWKNQ